MLARENIALVLRRKLRAFTGNPTDIASGDGLIAVVSASTSVSTIFIFKVDEDGNMTLTAAPAVTAPANGIAIIEPNE